MRIGPTPAVIAMGISVALPHAVVAQNVRAERQASLDQMLTSDAASNIAHYRADCAAGRKVAGIAQSRALGMTTLPDAVEYCVTVLIRTARDGNLHVLRNLDGSITPALALDTGFVAGYQKRESAASMPPMEAIRAPAERCLAQTEPDKDLCYSAGYAYGARAAGGETMQAR